MFELPARHVTWRIEVYPAILLFLIFICIFAGIQTPIFLPVAGFVCLCCLKAMEDCHKLMP